MGIFSGIIVKEEAKMAFLDTVKTALNNNKIIIIAAEPDSPIEKLLVIHKKDDSFKKCTLTKDQVIGFIEGNRKFVTLNTEDKILTDVYVVDGNFGKYLRTDREEDEEEDNLGALPSILFMKTIIDLHIQ